MNDASLARKTLSFFEVAKLCKLAEISSAHQMHKIFLVLFTLTPSTRCRSRCGSEPFLFLTHTEQRHDGADNLVVKSQIDG